MLIQKNCVFLLVPFKLILPEADPPKLKNSGINP